MVRRIFLALDNDKYEKLLQLKGEKTWEQLLVDDLLEKEGTRLIRPVTKRSKSNEV